MATSPAHKFGQIIGEAIQRGVAPLLNEFAEKEGLYLDQAGPRPCRKGKKCSWRDLYGNEHDLDFVLERGGTPEKRGAPVAFIEVAWRRYTKHSRNKAQEIQGALLPLVETHRSAGPFLGVILAGVFTEGAIKQLESLGFTVRHFSYDDVVNVFREFHVDALFDEKTRDAEFRRKIRAYGGLSVQRKAVLARKLVAARSEDVQRFMAALSATVLRRVDRVEILPLYGLPRRVQTVAAAVRLLEEYHEAADGGLERYEIRVYYNNGDLIEGKFKDKASAIAFLRAHNPVS